MSGRRTKRNPRGEEIAKMIMEQYRPENKEDMQAALKDKIIDFLLNNDIISTYSKKVDFWRIFNFLYFI